MLMAIYYLFVVCSMLADIISCSLIVCVCLFHNARCVDARDLRDKIMYKMYAMLIIRDVYSCCC